MKEHPFPDLASRISMKQVDEGCKLCRQQQHLVALLMEQTGKYELYCYFCLPVVAQDMLDRWNQRAQRKHRSRTKERRR